MERSCKICSIPSTYIKNDLFFINCLACGDYRITSEFYDDFNTSTLYPSDVSKIRGWIRENQNQSIDENLIGKLKKIDVPVYIKAQKLLKYISVRTQYPGQDIGIALVPDNKNFLKLLSICWLFDKLELVYFIEYLKKQNFIELKSGMNSATLAVTVTPEGFQYLYKFENEIQSNIGFCAMWFDQSLNSPWDQAIQPAIAGAGYQAIRIDKHPHNEGVMDEIIGLIRRSKFIIADLTGNRGGVYYEAGFAKGLGKSVIFTCNKNFFHTEKTHFDVNHYNFILWEDSDYQAFKQRLEARIESTIGRGESLKSNPFGTTGEVK